MQGTLCSLPPCELAGLLLQPKLSSPGDADPFNSRVSPEDALRHLELANVPISKLRLHVSHLRRRLKPHTLGVGHLSKLALRHSYKSREDLQGNLGRNYSPAPSSVNDCETGH